MRVKTTERFLFSGHHITLCIPPLNHFPIMWDIIPVSQMGKLKLADKDLHAEVCKTSK